jgi:hypothetical protein
VTRREVFVSYSQSDHDSAHELVARVESMGIRCWIAPRDITPAADWAEEIVDAIAASRVMVLVFSASANSSPQVRREVERAVHRGVSILTFRVEDVLPSKSLEYFLSTQHWLDAFPQPREQHYAQLCTYLTAILADDRFVAMPETEAPGTASLSAQTGHSAPVSHAVDAAELQQIEARLADFVGPVARHLVRRAAIRAQGMEQLIVQLGTEIESEKDRRLFISACRQMRPARS